MDNAIVKKHWLPLLLTSLLFLWLAPESHAVSSKQYEPSGIRLVLVIAVDQLRADYLERFRDGFSAGLARFGEKGVTFSHGHHAHAITSTGPGHATVSTGSFPSRSGIIGNQWYEKDGTQQTYCVGDARSPVLFSDGSYSRASEGRSPRNLLVTALGDWMKDYNPESRVVSASRKDRAAVLLGGKEPDAVFWYDPSTGGFVTSAFYQDELPEWLLQFNRRDLPKEFFGELWSPLPYTEKALKADQVLTRDSGWFSSGFPHAIGSSSPVPNSAFYTSFGGTPFMDAYLEELAELLIDVYELGKDEHPDYLGLSFSALDSIGHSYGPHSPESLDAVLRLDLTLGRLFQHIDKTIGLEHVAFALTADHGAMDLPEYRRIRNQEGLRIGAEDIVCVQRQGEAFVKHFGADEDWFLHGFYLDYSDIGRQNLKREQVERWAAEALAKCKHIRKVWTRTELEGPPSGDPFEKLYRDSYYPGRSPDLLIQHEKYFLPASGTGTTHGSPYEYDTHVPIVFLLPGIGPSRVEERVATADIAPTLAEVLGIAPPDNIDGRSLKVYFPPALPGR